MPSTDIPSTNIDTSTCTGHTTSIDDRYDVVVVGARAAGAATAMPTAS